MKPNYIISKTKYQLLKGALLLIGLQSCAAAAVKENLLYKKEVVMTIDGVKASGVYVAPKQTAAYQIRFELPDKPNVVKLSTCHREEIFRDVGKKLDYEYRPIAGLETNGSCLLEIAAFDEEGAHLWGLIEFAGTETMTGHVGCNGQTYLAKGVSFCQTRTGLIQTITFKNVVKVFSPERCPKMNTKDQLTFEYVMSVDKCIYLFSDGKEEHRHTTFGYEEVLIK